MPVNTKIQLRRGSASSWSSQNSVLSQGELGFDIDSGLFKIGDGSTAWNSLTYYKVKNIVQGSGIAVSDNGSGTFTVSLSDPTIQSTDIVDFLEAVQDVIGNNVAAGFGTSKSYDDAGTGFTTVSVTGMTNSLSAGSGGIFLASASASNNTQYTVHLTGVQPSTIVGVTSSAAELNYVDITTAGTAEATKALITDSSKNIYGINNLSASGATNLGTLQVGSNATVTGNLVVNGTISSTGNLTIGGDLLVNGNTVTVNSTTVTIDDPIFTLGGDTAGLNDNKDRGIEFKYNNGTAATGFFGYSDSNDAFVFITGATNSSEVFSGPLGPIRVGAATVTGTLTANAIAVTSTSVVSNLNADKLDGQDGSYYNDFNNATNKPSPVITVNLTGDITGSGNATLTNLGTNANISFATTIPASSIILGTDTTGQYASTITAAGSGLTATPSNANGATAYTITSNASASSGNGTMVLRDGTGSFSAGNITANSFIKSGGTSSQFLKGDGSVDSATYLTSASVGNGTLTLNVSGSGLTGSQTFTANQSSGATFTVTSNASSATGVGTLVLRDASGGFSAGAITATSFAGDGSSLTALNASNLSTGTVSNSRLNVSSTSGLGISTFSSTNFAVDSTGLVTIKTGGVANSTLVNSTLTLGSSTLTLGATTTAITGLASLAATNLYGAGANITALNASNINAGTIGVSYLPTNIPIVNLASSGMTFGSTFQALGSTISSLSNLTSISGTSSASPTTLHNCVIDGGTP